MLYKCGSESRGNAKQSGRKDQLQRPYPVRGECESRTCGAEGRRTRQSRQHRRKQYYCMSILIRFLWHPVRGWPGIGRGTGEPCTDQRLTRCKLFFRFSHLPHECFLSISVKINKKSCKVSPVVRAEIQVFSLLAGVTSSISMGFLEKRGERAAQGDLRQFCSKSKRSTDENE